MTDHPLSVVPDLPDDTVLPATSHTVSPRERRADPRRWEDALSRDTLDLIAEGVTQFAGFEAASVAVVAEDHVECVAVAGDDQHRRNLSTRAALSTVLDELAEDELSERPRFVWHRHPPRRLSEAPAPAWRPQDGIVIPLLGESRELVGLLSVDHPRDGRRPSAAQLRFLEQYAVQARRAILAAHEQEVLARRMDVARTTRRAVRRATTRLSLEAVVDECRDTLGEAFRARDVWLRLVEGLPADPRLVTEPEPGTPVAPDELMHRLQSKAWQTQQALVITVGRPAPAQLSDEETTLVRGVMAHYDIGSALLAPVGSGDECLGRLMLCRGRDDSPWTDAEAESALDIGHDLGRAVLNARTYEREHQLVEQLKAVDAYKSRLIATVAHELRTPLTSVLGNLELLDDGIDPTQVAAMLTRAHRGAQRLASLVDDLLLLSRVSDVEPPEHVLVDLIGVVHEVRDMVASDARAHGQEVVVDAADDQILLPGDRRELDQMVTNLVSNALKYSPPGRSVTLDVAREDDEVVLRCTDQGIGISAEDRHHLFREFFRAENDSTQRQAGTGLGLSIVARIVARHHGTVEVTSEVDVGSTFAVRLPAELA